MLVTCQSKRPQYSHHWHVNAFLSGYTLSLLRTALYLMDVTWFCQKPRCCCCWWWTQSLSWNEGDEAHFCTRGSSLLLAGFLHQSHCSVNLEEQECQGEATACDSLRGCMSSSACCTWQQVVIVTVTVRAGAAVRTAGPLPLPD